MNRGGRSTAFVLTLALAFLACGGNSRDGGGGSAGGVSSMGDAGSGVGARGGATGTAGEVGEAGEAAGGSGATENGGSAGSTAGGSAGSGGLNACGCDPLDLQCNTRCGGGVTPGDCKTDANCNGGQCLELTPGGYRVCASTPLEVTSCGSQDPQPFPNECCQSSECAEGICVAGPGPTYCGGPAIEPYNYCAVDACQSSADCDAVPNGVCFPAGSYGFPAATCVAGGCQVDADCKEEADGRCLLHQDQCCGSPSLVCVYADGCVKNADCPEATPNCLVEDGRGVCSATPQACPL